MKHIPRRINVDPELSPIEIVLVHIVDLSGTGPYVWASRGEKNGDYSMGDNSRAIPVGEHVKVDKAKVHAQTRR